MSLTTRDIMRTDFQIVEPEMTLSDLERAFFTDKTCGFAVIQQGCLVGLVDWADIVRRLYLEQSLSEQVEEYYSAAEGFVPDGDEALEEIGDRVGERLEHLCVRDVMSRNLTTVALDETVQTVAKLLVDNCMPRVPVVDGERLVGMVTLLDLAGLLADGRAKVD